MDFSLKTPQELQQELGSALKSLRLSKNLTQRDLAERAGVSLRALASLERGGGSSVETLVRALKGLDATGIIEHLAPQVSISPMAMLKTPTPRQRARKPRTQAAP